MKRAIRQEGSVRMRRMSGLFSRVYTLTLARRWAKDCFGIGTAMLRELGDFLLFLCFKGGGWEGHKEHEGHEKRGKVVSRG